MEPGEVTCGWFRHRGLGWVLFGWGGVALPLSAWAGFLAPWWVWLGWAVASWGAAAYLLDRVAVRVEDGAVCWRNQPIPWPGGRIEAEGWTGVTFETRGWHVDYSEPDSVGLRFHRLVGVTTSGRRVPFGPALRDRAEVEAAARALSTQLGRPPEAAADPAQT